MSSRRGGFTIVEVLIAVVVLSIGVLAMASSVGTINRMMANGKRKSQSYSIASRAIDSVRRVAGSTTPKCTAVTNGTTTLANNSPYGTAFTRTLIVSNDGSNRTVEVRTAYRIGPYPKGDTIIATLSC